MIFKTQLNDNYFLSGYKLFRKIAVRPWVRRIAYFAYFSLLLFIIATCYLWYLHDGSIHNGRALVTTLIFGLIFILWGRYRIYYYGRKHPYYNKCADMDINESGITMKIDADNEGKSGWDSFQSARISKDGICLAYKGVMSFVYIRFSDLTETQINEANQIVAKYVSDYQRI